MDSKEVQQEKRLLAIETSIQTIGDKVDSLSNNIESLLAAWTAAGWLVSLIKWAGGLALALGAIYSLIKGFK